MYYCNIPRICITFISQRLPQLCNNPLLVLLLLAPLLCTLTSLMSYNKLVWLLTLIEEKSLQIFISPSVRLRDGKNILAVDHTHSIVIRVEKACEPMCDFMNLQTYICLSRRLVIDMSTSNYEDLNPTDIWSILTFHPEIQLQNNIIYAYFPTQYWETYSSCPSATCVAYRLLWQVPSSRRRGVEQSSRVHPWCYPL